MANGTNLPPVTNNNLLPLVPPKQPRDVRPPQIDPTKVRPVGGQQPGADQLSQQVLQTAQQRAIQPLTGTPLQQQTQQATQQLLQQPLGFDPQKFQQAQTEQLRQGRQQQLEALRQKTAGVAGTGQRLSDLTQLALQGAREEAVFGTGLERDLAQQQIENQIRALGEARATTGQEAGLRSQEIQNLLATRAGAEPELGRRFEAGESAIDRGLAIATANQNSALQTSLTELRGQIESGQLLQGQNFEASQAELDREQQKAIQAGDIDGQVRIATLQNELQTLRDEAQRDFSRTERNATQSWQTGERVDTQDFQKNMQYLDQQHDFAVQQGDIQGQFMIEDLRAMNQLKALTQEQSFEEKMQFLDNQYRNAFANNDVERQRRISEFQTNERLRVLAEEQGFDAAQADIQRQHQLALQNNDHVQANAIQKSEFAWRANEAAKDRALDEARIALQDQQIQMQNRQMTFDQIQSEVEAGRIDPQAAVDAIQQHADREGITITAIDQGEAQRAATEAQFDALRLQFAQTNPDLLEPDPDNPGRNRLSIDGQAAFNDWFNSTIYGPGQDATLANLASGQFDQGELLGKDMDDPDFAALFNDADEWIPKSTKSGRGFWSPDVRTIDNAPAIGTPFKWNGRLLTATSGIAEEAKGQNYQYFTAKDLSTGETLRIRANESGTGVTSNSSGGKDFSLKGAAAGALVGGGSIPGSLIGGIAGGVFG